MTDFAKKISELRAELGLSRQAVQELTHISMNTLRNWEMGTRVPAEWAQYLVLDKLKGIRKEQQQVENDEPIPDKAEELQPIPAVESMTRGELVSLARIEGEQVARAAIETGHYADMKELQQKMIEALPGNDFDSICNNLLMLLGLTGAYSRAINFFIAQDMNENKFILYSFLMALNAVQPQSNTVDNKKEAHTAENEDV
ncbi:helix-turn-helix domain-containing protein [Megasphaera stantonii]|uniref:helix-turn-helix domain-containing protein n=1 Tax=Megasphaera stantonii TaxID=2144175 RepID=UPI001959E091|nr:helix-turn-helix transcriptional regulator [Megasphaera stantonii]MBM6731877.1 helix-turn-helix transcriptional regulator [Megasphaera stantonii]